MRPRAGPSPRSRLRIRGFPALDFGGPTGSDVTGAASDLPGLGMPEARFVTGEMTYRSVFASELQLQLAKRS